jgi:YfiH family protein
MSPDPSSPGPAIFWRPRDGRLPDNAWFGMTTRIGGVSAGPYATLNLGLAVGDQKEAVIENRKRMRAAAGVPEDGPRMPRQVHGTTIIIPAEAGSEADGVLVRAGDPWVAVTVADCAPVAVVAEGAAQGALLHSGWRGSRDGIAVRAVERLTRDGAPPASLSVSIGPCIHACCYPVGPDVAKAVPASVLVPHPGGRFALDLPELIVLSLIGAGIDRARIDVAPECTSCLRDRFYSHRRDAGITGRHWALLRLTPAAR